jgi:hypothetical protein
MKKLILSAIVLLGAVSVTNASTVSQEVKVITISVQTEYTEVTADAVPAAVKTALQTAYPGAKLDKAFVNEKKEYKLEISVGDQKATVYSDVNGNWLKI